MRHQKISFRKLYYLQQIKLLGDYTQSVANLRLDDASYILKLEDRFKDDRFMNRLEW